VKIFPYAQYLIKCHLTTEQIISKLSDNTEPSKMFSLGRGSKVFKGRVESNDFKISRSIGYRNSFLPVINGTLVPCGETVDIHIKMHLHPSVIVFMFVWISIVLVALVASTVAFFRDLEQGSPTEFQLLTMPYAMLLFGILLCTVPFWLEVKRAKYELDRIFGVYAV